MIRAATLADSEAILGILLEETKKYPLRPDLDKMKKVIVDAISSAQHFAWVVEKNRKVLGVLLGLTSDNLWAQRKNCNIVAWVSKSPGEGISLLREFTNWVKFRRAIRVAGMTIDCEVDERVWSLAERLGFEKRNGTLVLFN